MQRVTSESWDGISQSGKAVIEFSAQWCGPCRIQRTILGAVANEHSDVCFGEVDIESDFELADRFKVSSVPTILIMSNGEVKERLNGLQQKSTFDKLLQS